MAVMFRGGLAAGGSNVAGTLVALGVPLASAVNVNALWRFHASIDLLPAVLIGAALSALVALPLAVPLKATTHDLTLLSTLGVFQLGIPCMLIVVASRRLSAVEISLLLLIEVVLGPAWSWLGAGEMPARATLAGGALVLAALLADQLLAPRVARR
jgi:drug/metabolite transporter (DMT)-like permease